MLTGQIRNQIDAIWNKFWTGGVTNPISVIEQISYLLFIRGLDAAQTQLDQQALVGAVIDKPIFSAEQQHLRWSKFKDKDPQAMFELVRDQVFPFIKTLGDKQGSKFAQHMKDAIFMIPRADILDQVVQMISAIDLKDRDTKGDVYEYLLSKIQESGVNGQFRTPRHIIKMMVALLRPQIDDTICDPAAGTCGFLMAANEYVREHYKNDLLKPTHRQHFQKTMFTGFDFDQHMLRIGAMNMMLHGLDDPNVIYRDSLADEGAANLSEAFSMIFANPPFKGSVNYDAIAPDLLTALGKTPKKDQKPKKDADGKVKTPTEKSELLFLALILRLLKKGGHAAVIVPDGVLFGSTKAHVKIRETLVEQHELQAVISMPSGVFKPYAGVSTAILIFQKTGSGGTDQVWFYDMQADGFSLDDKRTELTKEGETPKHEHNNIPDILARWENQAAEAERQRTEQSFRVSKAEIVAQGYDLSINRYKQVVYEAVDYDAPTVILGRIKALQASMDQGISELEKLL